MNGLPPLREALLVALGGGLGSTLRYTVGWYLLRLWPAFPFGTLVVNVVGCFAFGVMVGMTEDRLIRTGVGAGILGGFTTFSAFGGDTLALAQSGQWKLAGLYLVGNLALGLGAVWLGRHLATG
jgi:CrcB protein